MHASPLLRCTEMAFQSSERCFMFWGYQNGEGAYRQINEQVAGCLQAAGGRYEQLLRGQLLGQSPAKGSTR